MTYKVGDKVRFTQDYATIPRNPSFSPRAEAGYISEVLDVDGDRGVMVNIRYPEGGTVGQFVPTTVVEPISDLDAFLWKYATGDENGAHARAVTGVVVQPQDSGVPSPFIIIKDGNRVAIINPMSLSDHLCIDVHVFIDGKQATAGVFGMTEGRRHELKPTGHTSHGWASANLIAVLLGEQRADTKED